MSHHLLKIVHLCYLGFVIIVVIRLHRLHVVHEMHIDVTRSMVCVSVCLLVTRMYCAKMAEPIEMPFWRLTSVGLRNHVLNGSQDRADTFEAAKGDMQAMRPFANLL